MREGILIKGKQPELDGFDPVLLVGVDVRCCPEGGCFLL